MDTSEQYIKMCRRAPKIQALCERKIGDFFYDGNQQACPLSESNYVAVVGSFIIIGEKTITQGGYDYDFYDIDWGGLVWLPRQDQLQEMTDPSCSQRARMDLVYLIYKFYKDDLVATMHCSSMEQLVLAFYMSERHHKIWDGESWREK